MRMSRNLSILVLMVVALVAGTATAKDKPRPRDGEYNVSAAGYFKGQGTAQLSGNKIKLQMTVVAADGKKGDLTSPGLTIDGNHFTGTGTALGLPVKFEGRVDAPDSEDEKSIRGVRMVGLVKTADGKYSRLVGFIPSMARTPDKIDDDDRERGRRN
jgi:hypothetical protein